VRLPAAIVEAKPQPEPHEEKPKLRGRILVIDDEPHVGTAMRRVLTQHDVVTSTSAAEGLSLLAEDQAFDMILCDLAMPDRSGQDFYEELLASQPELVERVVFVSGGAFTPQLTTFLQKVPRPCLSKPFGAAELREQVARFLQARQDSAPPPPNKNR
jgi:CheY-like chemotaxis protein